ncbi:PadR family transcriptional regulator [Amycolatopsis jiangsuensis]|uniref:DNA-binding PadR family transcriptional regulator n=1 Tax=Amycolatopsis jiangsuensis TaxID=1181879 RepID=A0A840IWJ4_9PSEU|nr:PadR family transcriptional regulator [Amycolatopsis jiangsuensis]MBB4685889.1 DNA-binding PadR family transcriptional regulator [Amycolatopsis jiangsuensis]
MAARNRGNPLALAALICLYERPMHPYEVATTLRQRNKHESVRLNYGSLYAVFGSLEKRGLISEAEVTREGRLPERTVYELTGAGLAEIHDWMAELVGVPRKEYPDFEAALALLVALPPDQVLALLRERADRLEVGISQSHAAGEVLRKQQVPRLLRVETEFHTALLDAELAFVRRLADELESGSLEGLDWWRTVHGDGPVAPPVPRSSTEERT